MKNIKIGIALTLTFFLFLMSCKREDIEFSCFLEDVQTPVTIDCKLTRDIDSTNLYIKGSWVWLQEETTQRGIGATYRTPKNQGYSRMLELHDSTAKFYKCGQLEVTYKFSILKEKEITGTNYPEDEYPSLVTYDVKTGVRASHVPLKICSN